MNPSLSAFQWNELYTSWADGTLQTSCFWSCYYKNHSDTSNVQSVLGCGRVCVCLAHTTDALVTSKPHGLLHQHRCRQLLFSRLEVQMLRAASPQQTQHKITDGALEEFPAPESGEQCESLGCRWALPSHLVYLMDETDSLWLKSSFLLIWHQKVRVYCYTLFITSSEASCRSSLVVWSGFYSVMCFSPWAHIEVLQQTRVLLNVLVVNDMKCYFCNALNHAQHIEAWHLWNSSENLNTIITNRITQQV